MEKSIHKDLESLKGKKMNDFSIMKSQRSILFSQYSKPIKEEVEKSEDSDDQEIVLQSN